tara:strand:+ start:631 stop:1296 length:666 start_codon:yes stop_codon:yes gene_type:complete
MYETVVFNGCSFVYGVGTKQRPLSYWFKNKFDINTKNIASPGASNDKIFRTTYEHLEKNKYDNGLVILGLTHWARKEFYSPILEPDYFTFKPSAWIDKFSKNNMFPELNDDNLNFFTKIVTKYFFEEKYEIENILRNVHLLKCYLDTKNLDLLVFKSLWLDIEDIDGISFYKFTNNLCWKDYLESLNPDFDSENYGHPGHPTHIHQEELADKLYEFIKGGI